MQRAAEVPDQSSFGPPGCKAETLISIGPTKKKQTLAKKTKVTKAQKGEKPQKGEKRSLARHLSETSDASRPAEPDDTEGSPPEWTYRLLHMFWLCFWLAQQKHESPIRVS